MSDEESIREDAKREEWERKRDRGDFRPKVCRTCHGTGGNCPDCQQDDETPPDDISYNGD